MRKKTENCDCRIGGMAKIHAKIQEEFGKRGGGLDAALTRAKTD